MLSARFHTLVKPVCEPVEVVRIVFQRRCDETRVDVKNAFSAIDCVNLLSNL